MRNWLLPPSAHERQPRVSMARRVVGASSRALLAWLLLGCDPFRVEFDPVEPAQRYRATTQRAAPLGERLVVVTYNIKFAGGRIDFFFDCHGDRVLMSTREVEKHLERLAEVIRALNPDVLFLQEVDVNSKRSAHIDQMQWLLDHTDLNYGVYASQWRADFVPSDGIGAVDSGNAVLSRWPFTGAERLALPLRGDQSALERYFYLRRNMLRAHVELPNGVPLGLLAVHAEAFSKDDTKKQHIERFTAELDRLAGSGVVVGAGDLNTLPPGSQQWHRFDDSACEGDYEADDYRAERGWLDALYARYSSAIPLDAYAADNHRFFTHTTRADGFWNRKLDYIFSTLPLENGMAHQSVVTGGIETLSVSDHAPLSAQLEVPSR